VHIGRPSEKEQTRGAVIERYGDGDQRALAGSKHSTRRTEGDISWNIGECCPIQVALIA